MGKADLRKRPPAPEEPRPNCAFIPTLDNSHSSSTPSLIPAATMSERDPAPVGHVDSIEDDGHEKKKQKKQKSRRPASMSLHAHAVMSDLPLRRLADSEKILLSASSA